METLIQHLLDGAGNQWLGLVVLALYLIDRLGIVKTWMGGKVSERERLSEDQQYFVATLRLELERCAADRVAWAKERKELRDQIEALIRGEVRWRHLVNNCAQYIVALRFQLSKAGIATPRFRGWDNFIGEGGNPEDNEYLAELSRGDG